MNIFRAVLGQITYQCATGKEYMTGTRRNQNWIAIIWPGPDRHPTNWSYLAGFLTGFDICIMHK